MSLSVSLPGTRVKANQSYQDWFARDLARTQSYDLFKCGAYVPPGVRFCSNCGRLQPIPDNSHRSDAIWRFGRTTDQDLERTVFTVRPTLIFIKAGYALAVCWAIRAGHPTRLDPVPYYISIPLALLCC